MLKQKIIYSNAQLNQLKQEVEKVFGRKILNSNDCTQLQQEINSLSKANASLSLNTTRRFFNIIESKTNISHHTINVLCNYCGYDDMNDFIANYSMSKKGQATTNIEFIKILYSDNLQQRENKLFAALHIEMLEMILTNESIFQTVFPKLVRYPLFQEYVLSFHPMIDQLNCSWYMKGIKIFASRSKLIHIKVFGIALEFLRNLLNNELDLCKDLVSEMQKLETKLFTIDKDKPFPQARLLASLYIYFSHTSNTKLANEYRKKILNTLCDNLKKSKQEEANEFDFLMCVLDYLLLYEDYEFATELVELFSPIFKNKHTTTIRQLNAYCTIIALLQATCLCFKNKKKEARKILQQVEISNLTFEFKKFYTVRFLMLQIQLSNQATNKVQVLQKQSQQLISELGYKKFQTQFNAIFKN